MRPFLLRAGIALMGAAGCTLGAAQSFPSKPIRLIAPFSPGGTTDILARIIAQKLSESFGSQVIVDNRAGAGGTVGLTIAARADPDGHTIA
ncbi:MAG TPA: tripartite tricarboxylate transporter substrate-binding protein, partial [Burkholderiales bacterium]|nr:tripartite tricarboxylate transporter substrate-binding protein [Burkholderiales bacterium]